jgi:hypothetical protein
MTASITLNNQQVKTHSFTRKPTNHENQFNSIYSNQIAKQRPKENWVEQIQFSEQITHIKRADLEAIYNEIKLTEKNELNELNFEQKELKPFDYLEGNIDKIMYHPIEVKIDRDEVYTAIIYNRMGINYLDLKRIETRMGLLEIAKEDVEASAEKGNIRKDQAKSLLKQISVNRNELEDDKRALFDNKQMKENEQRLFEQLTKGITYTENI